MVKACRHERRVAFVDSSGKVNMVRTLAIAAMAFASSFVVSTSIAAPASYKWWLVVGQGCWTDGGTTCKEYNSALEACQDLASRGPGFSDPTVDTVDQGTPPSSVFTCFAKGLGCFAN